MGVGVCITSPNDKKKVIKLNQLEENVIDNSIRRKCNR